MSFDWICVLVDVNRDDPSLFEEAGGVAGAYGDICVVTVIPRAEGPASETALVQARLRAATEARLSEVEDDCRQRCEGEGEVSSKVLEGEFAEAVESYLESSGHDLVVTNDATPAFVTSRSVLIVRPRP